MGSPTLGIRGRSLLAGASVALTAIGVIPSHLVARAAAAPPAAAAAFEANIGQADPAVSYLLRDGLTTAFTDTGLVIEVPPAPASLPAMTRTDPLATMHALEALPLPSLLHVGWVGGDTTHLQASSPTVARTSYIIGAVASGWHSDVPAYGSLSYNALYPGVDVAYTVAGDGLESTYTVAPGADASQIALQYTGMQTVAVAQNGSLTITLLDGRTLTERAPSAWQTLGGARVPVSVAFIVNGGNVRFALGTYDHTAPLTIDPTFVFSTFLGGSAEDHPWATATDASGDSYVAGYTYSTDFPVTPGVYQAMSNGSSDVFVTKLDPAGQPVYSTYLGGSNFDNCFAISVDGNGDAYVTGATLSSDFPVTSGAYQSANNAATTGGSDAFVAELDPTGAHLLASTLLGGTVGDQLQGPGIHVPPQTDNESLGVGVTTDSTGAVYVGIETDAVDFPTSSGAPQGQVHGNYDGAITKLSPSLGALDYSTYIGGENYDFVSTIAVDGSGDAYVTGETTSATLFPTTSGAYQTTQASGYAAFIAELNAAGTAWDYVTFFHGTTDTCGSLGLYTVPTAMLVDSSGDVYFTGETSATDTPVTTGIVAPPPANFCTAAYVTELNPTGSGLVQSAMFGGGDYNGGFGLGRDSAGNIWIDGYTSSHDFPVTADAMQAAKPAGTHSAFVSALAPDMSHLVYSSYLGGSGDDYGYGLAVDPSDRVHVSGITQSPDFPTANAFQPAYAGGSAAGNGFDDGFVAVLATSPAANVPEVPSPLWLAGAALVAAFAQRRRQRR